VHGKLASVLENIIKGSKFLNQMDNHELHPEFRVDDWSTSDLERNRLKQWVTGQIASGYTMADSLEVDSAKLKLAGDLEGSQTLHEHALRVLGMSRHRIGYDPLGDGVSPDESYSTEVGF
jgi:hypothetical protein